LYVRWLLVVTSPVFDVASKGPGCDSRDDSRRATLHCTRIVGSASGYPDRVREIAFIGIAPGTYTLKAALSGFVTQERNEIEVALGGLRSITMEMPQGTFGGEIEVGFRFEF
jgi:hypothetical protein